MEASPMFFIIDRPFAPFTKAVVLLARCPELSPDPVVVKIYDPRFLDERLPDSRTCPTRPWSLEAERGADAIWDEPFHELDLYEDYPDDAEGQATLAALWEKHFRILSTGCFKDEREVYDRLRPLQGTAIPRLLLTGTVLPPDERAIQPQAVVLEYIADAVSLCDVPPELATPELCTSLLRTVDSFAGRGVVHTDVNWNNVLFTPRERPTRVVVIDFGCGGVRTDEQDDDAWRECVEWNDDGRRARRVLRERGINVPDV